MSATPKQWSIKVISPAAGALQILRDGQALPAEIGAGFTTPVEVLLVSVGTCFALSCHAAFGMRNLQRVALEVHVTGRKAAQLPSRLAEISVQVTYDPVLTREQGQSISALAKQLCTVTNTLSSDPPCAITVESTP